MMFIRQWVTQLMNPEDLHRGTALVILWGYGYQIVVWPGLWWGVAWLNAYGVIAPLPPIIPWEQLMAATTTLAAVSGINAWASRQAVPAAAPQG